MYRCSLHKRRVHRWHGFAAILTVVTVRRALHRVTALHRFLSGVRGTAVERIGGQRDREQDQQKCSDKLHRYKSRDVR